MGWFPFLRLCFGPYVSGQILEREMMLRSKKLVTFATSHGSIWGGRKKESRKEVSFFSVSLSIWSAHVIIDLTYSVIFLSIFDHFCIILNKIKSYLFYSTLAISYQIGSQKYWSFSTFSSFLTFPKTLPFGVLGRKKSGERRSFLLFFCCESVNLV